VRHARSENCHLGFMQNSHGPPELHPESRTLRVWVAVTQLLSVQPGQNLGHDLM
jgi:hypothetical protein